MLPGFNNNFTNKFLNIKEGFVVDEPIVAPVNNKTNLVIGKNYTNTNIDTNTDTNINNSNKITNDISTVNTPTNTIPIGQMSNNTQSYIPTQQPKEDNNANMDNQYKLLQSMANTLKNVSEVSRLQAEIKKAERIPPNTYNTIRNDSMYNNSMINDNMRNDSMINDNMRNDKMRNDNMRNDKMRNDNIRNDEYIDEEDNELNISNSLITQSSKGSNAPPPPNMMSNNTPNMKYKPPRAPRAKAPFINITNIAPNLVDEKSIYHEPIVEEEGVDAEMEETYDDIVEPFTTNYKEGFTGSSIIKNNINTHILLTLIITILSYLINHKNTKRQINSILNYIDRTLKTDKLLTNNKVIINMLIFGLIVFILLRLITF